MPRALKKHLTWNSCPFSASNQIAAIFVDEHPDYPAHDHKFVELVLVAAGSCLQETALGRAKIARGTVSIFRPGAWHAYTQSQHFEVYNCCFDPAILGRELSWMIDDASLGRLLWTIPLSPAQHGTNILRLPENEVKRCERLLNELCSLNIESKTDYRTELLGLLVQLLGKVARHLPVKPVDKPRNAQHPAVTASLKLIDDNPAYDWTLEELAALARTPRPYLVRLFTRTAGLPPMAYLRRRRLELATKLLVESDRPVGDVGQEVGWPDANYFTRRFHAQFGLTPTAYRDRFTRVSSTMETIPGKFHRAAN